MIKEKDLKNRINELKFQRKDPTETKAMVLPALIGFTMIFTAAITFYATNTAKYKYGIIWAMFLYVIIGAIVVPALWEALKEVHRIDKSLKNNYDVLMGRKKEDPVVWRRSVLLNRTNRFAKVTS